MRVFGAHAYDLSQPEALAVVGPHLFVASDDQATGSPGSMSEINISTGALVRVIDAPKYGFEEPVGMVADNGDLFVANRGASGPAGHPTRGYSITELSASTGALVRVIGGPRYELQPWSVTSVGPYIFVANLPTDSVTEVKASNGALVRVISGPRYEFDRPRALVGDGDDIVVGNTALGIALVNTITGGIVQESRARPTSSMAPTRWSRAVVTYTLPTRGNSLTELDASTGALVRVITGAVTSSRTPTLF